MRLKSALLIIMRKWQITGYRLAQAAAIDRAVVAKLIKGDVKTANWERVEELLKGFEVIDPIAKAAFLGALQIPDSAYPSLTENTTDIFWERETEESITEVLAVLIEYKLIDVKNIEKLKVALAKKDAEIGAFFPTTIESFIGSKMAQKRREQDGI